MSYRPNELGLLLQLEPQTAKARILDAYRKTEGVVANAAKLLGVDERTLNRWTTKLSLRRFVDRIRKDAGRRPSTTYSNGIPPPKKKRKRH